MVIAEPEMTSQPVVETVTGPIAGPLVSVSQSEGYIVNRTEATERPNPRLKSRERDGNRTQFPPEVIPNTIGLGRTSQA